MVVIEAPARTLTKIADANFAVRFTMCTFNYATQHYLWRISAKTWATMGRNFGQEGAGFRIAPSRIRVE
jgi:hypothetical protein